MNYYMGCKQSHLSTLAADQTADQTKMSDLPPSLQLNKSLFISTGILGEGGFGKVLAGMFVKNGQWYAVKEVKKVRRRISTSTTSPFYLYNPSVSIRRQI